MTNQYNDHQRNGISLPELLVKNKIEYYYSIVLWYWYQYNRQRPRNYHVCRVAVGRVHPGARRLYIFFNR